LKRFISAAAITLSVLAPAVHAQMDGMKGMDMKDGSSKGEAASKGSEARSHHGVGVVKKIDAAKGTVTIAHEPIPTMKWPKMTMAFVLKNKELLEKLAPEQKVEFEFSKQGSQYVISSLK
jgi:Cu(I)/Ag(I) efflux system protein CusF